MRLAPGTEVTLRIDQLSAGGRGVGRLNGLAVHVDDTAPGDVIRARLIRLTGAHAEAELIRVEEASSDRVTPRCPHVGTCGGCRWQHLDYRAQAAAKEAAVREHLRGVAGHDQVPVRPIIAAGDPWHFRNKMEFSFQPPDRVGLHRRGRWDEVVDLQTCFLPSPRTVTVLRVVREFIRRHGVACYDTRIHQGFLRHLVVREGHATGELLVALVTAAGPFPHSQDLAQALHREVPGITGLVWAVNASQSDAVEVSAVSVLDGRPFIYERLGGLTFKLGLLTFFQTNTTQAERMLEVVREFAGLRGTEQVLDLYCGVGTFALALAGQAAEVTGIEALQAATEAARDNAALNTITNALFYTAPAAHLRWVLAPRGHPDVVILDPPRAGAGVGVTREIGGLAPRRIVYVSCNPVTLASDVRDLRSRGYEVTAIQPVDLFPHTDHVECVVQLERTVER